MEINDTKPSHKVDTFGWPSSKSNTTTTTRPVNSNDLNTIESNRYTGHHENNNELKSISLVKSTIKSHHLSNDNNICDASKLIKNILATETTSKLMADKYKSDLDEAFRDLMNVSASLKQMAERSPLGYNSFRRHSIDNVLDEEPISPTPPTRERQLSNTSYNVIEKPKDKPVPAPRRKIYETPVTTSQAADMNERVRMNGNPQCNGITGRK